MRPPTGGSQKGPKTYYVIFAQPLTLIAVFFVTFNRVNYIKTLAVHSSIYLPICWSVHLCYISFLDKWASRTLLKHSSNWPLWVGVHRIWELCSNKNVSDLKKGLIWRNFHIHICWRYEGIQLQYLVQLKIYIFSN